MLEQDSGKNVQPKKYDMSILYLKYYSIHCGMSSYNSRLPTFPPHTYRLTRARALPTFFLYDLLGLGGGGKYRKNTHRYFLGFSVSLCCATEKPKRLPLVFPSFITGKRTSTLNPRHVCAVYSMQKKKRSRVLGAIFRSRFGPSVSLSEQAQSLSRAS